jgi:iron complex outermembrane receptor protein
MSTVPRSSVMHSSRSFPTSAPPMCKPLVFAMRVAYAGVMTTCFLGHANAQTSPAQKQDVIQDVGSLPEVSVKAVRPDVPYAPYAGGQTARGGRLGMLGNTNVMNAPFSISSYTDKTIKDQQAGTIADVLAKDSSVRTTGQTGGILDAFFIRGFPIGEGNLGEVAFDGQYGVAPNFRVFSEYVDRIELIKGPAALLYGMSPNSGIGGIINIVPKRASDKDVTRVTADYASDSQIGAHLDVGRRFGQEGQFGVRFNGSHRQGDTPIDNQSREATVGAVALDFQGKQFKASLDLIDQREQFDAPSRPFLVGAGVAVPDAPDGQRNVTQAWEWAKIDDQSVLLRTEYELNDKVTLFANAGGVQTDVSRLFGTPTILNAAGDTSSTPQYFKFDIERSTSDVGARTRFKTAGIDHTLTFQASAYRDSLKRGSTNGTAVTSNIYNPVAKPAQAVAAPTLVPKISETELTGFALADTMSMYDDRVMVTLGARQQQIKSDNFDPATGAVTSSYDKSAVTPLVGVVYKPWQQVSLYANYIEGLSKGDIAPPTASNAGEVFAPYKSKQQELGVKFDHGSLMTTLSVFQITKPNGELTGGAYAVSGEQRNRGVEINVAGEPTSGVRLLGGVTFIDAKLTRTNSATTTGNKAVGVPSVQANLGGEWDASWLPGLTLTGGLTYTGKQYVDQTNARSLPSWTKVDLGARYTTRLGGRSTTFRANVLNAFDRDYWSSVASWGGFVQGAPRTLMLSATMDF